MKKYLLLSLLLLQSFFSSYVHASDFFTEFKVGYFSPHSDVLQDIYPHGWANYQVELSYSPFNTHSYCWWQHFYAWASCNFLHADGESTSGLNHCTIHVVPVAAGIKYIYPLARGLDLYASAGPKYFFISIDNKQSDYPKDRARGLGGVFAAGALFYPYKCLCVDFFADYSLKHINSSHFSRRYSDTPTSFDISGLTLGVGIGVRF